MMVNTPGQGTKQRTLKSFKQLRNKTMVQNKQKTIENHLTTNKLKISVEDMIHTNKKLEKMATLEPLDPSEQETDKMTTFDAD